MVTQAVIGVPLYTLADYDGMGLAPMALRRAGLARSLGGVDLGDVELPPLKRDNVQGDVKNLTHFKACTSLTYRRVRSIQADRIMIIGGECSETVGAMAGVSEAFGGKGGMLWMDAHGDFNTPETSPSGYIGGMCLAMVCGRVPGMGIELGRNAPPIADDRLVHIGARALDKPEVDSFDSSSAKLFTSRQVKKAGAEKVAIEAIRKLDRSSDWIACHLDLDVIDPTLIPSVNYPTPGGLSFEEVALLIRSALRTGKLRVLEIAAYNASKDKGGSTARRIVNFVTKVLT